MRATPKLKEQFKASVIQKARELFLENGVEATSMADLGRALGVSKPTVYEAFASKQALVDAVFFAAAEDVDLTWLKEAMLTPPPFDEFLDRMADAYKDYLKSPKRAEVFQLVVREGSHSTDLRRAFGNRLAVPSALAVKKIVNCAKEQGQCKPMSTEVIQKMLVAPMYFLMIDKAMFGENAMPMDAAIAYVDHSFAALKSHLCTNCTKGSSDAKVTYSAPENGRGNSEAA